MTTQEMQQFAQLVENTFVFGFIDGVAYTLAAFKLVDLICDAFEWGMPRLSRFLHRQLQKRAG